LAKEAYDRRLHSFKQLVNCIERETVDVGPRQDLFSVLGVLKFDAQNL
jgi:hypothetical protein